MKRLLSAILALMMCFTMFAADACAENTEFPKEIMEWRDLVKVIYDGYYVGLFSDGTVSAVNGEGKADDYCKGFSDWKDVSTIYRTDCGVCGVTKSGDVLVHESEQPSVMTAWKNVDRLIWNHDDAVYAITKDGKVYGSAYGTETIPGLKNVIALAADDMHEDTFAVASSDGKVKICGLYEDEVNADSWKNIRQLYFIDLHAIRMLIGVDKSGRVYALTPDSTNMGDDGSYDGTPIFKGWKDITDIQGYNLHIVGLKKDGSIEDYDISSYRASYAGWKNIKDISGISLWGYQAGIRKNGGVIQAGEDHAVYYSVTESPAVDIVALKDGCCLVLCENGRLDVQYAENNVTVPEGRPSVEDIIALGDEKNIGLPKDSQYLDEYEIKYVQAPKGNSIYVYNSSSGTDEYKRPWTAHDGSAVIVLAVKGNMSCVIYTTSAGVKKAGWVYSAFLAD